MDGKFDIGSDRAGTLFKGSILLLDSHESEGLKLCCANSCTCNCESLVCKFLEAGEELDRCLLSDDCISVVLFAFLNAGVEDDRKKLPPFPEKGLDDKLLSDANLFARGALNPFAVEVVLFFCHTVELAKEELLCTWSVEVLFFSLTLSLVFMLLRDSKGLLE